jgi:hypothetical protein
MPDSGCAGLLRFGKEAEAGAPRAEAAGPATARQIPVQRTPAEARQDQEPEARSGGGR